jgi:hypothetical protein
MRGLEAASAAAALLFAPTFALPVGRTHHEDTDLASESFIVRLSIHWSIAVH